jgi:hypothetical protein
LLILHTGLFLPQSWDDGLPLTRAVHESGHATVAWFVSPMVLVKKVRVMRLITTYHGADAL